MSGIKKVAISVVLASVFCVSSFADEPKRTLNSNMTENYLILPKEAKSFDEMFSNGVFYGRLRMNSFKYDYEDEKKASAKNNVALGLGGSLIYKTATLNGFSYTAGAYTSQNPIDGMNQEKEDIRFVKSGKDTLDRNKIKNGGTYDGSWGMTALAQNFIQYSFDKTDIKAGSQIFESFITSSNDTKMIPNTFNGYAISSKCLAQSEIKLGYFTEQKLRDHTDFHDVIAFDSWNENDDSAVHQGLTKAKLDDKNIQTKLIVLDISNKSIKNTKIDLGYSSLPELFSSAMAEVNHKISFSQFNLTAGARYFMQIDDGAGKIGTASLAPSNIAGYNDADSVDGSLYAIRLIASNDIGSLMLGFSDVSDDADIISPWRSFPTGGYTRAMAQTNWIANTKSSMIQAKYDFSKAGIIKDFEIIGSYSMLDFDQKKGNSDKSVVHIDFNKNKLFLPNLYSKIRVAFVDEEELNNKNSSYSEYRFELNYLF